MLVKRTWAEIRLDNIKSNFDEIKRIVGPDVSVLAVIKANGYGHGAKEVALSLEEHGADWFGVATIVEAVELRRAGVTKPILITGYTPPELAGVLADNAITQTLLSLEYSKQLSDHAAEYGARVDCHVKLDTGMSRIGYDTNDIAQAADEIADTIKLPYLSVTGIFTHFTSADMFDDESVAFTIRQGETFASVVAAAEQRGAAFKHKHCCNSAGLLYYGQFHFNMVRPGIILYGISPTGEDISEMKLLPSMTLKSMVAQVKHIQKGDSVGYCRDFVATGDMTIATVPIGYADGYFRIMKDRGLMWVRGELAPVIGRINMDQLVIDVTNIPVECGDEVVVFGGESPITADNIAGLSETNSYEWITGVSRRVPRVFLDGGVQVGYEDYML